MHLLMRRPVRLKVAFVMLAALLLAAAPASSAPPRDEGQEARVDLVAAARAAQAAPVALGRTRTAVPQDRYAMAGGCYAIRAAANGRYLARQGGTLVATAAAPEAGEAVHFQATDLGRYLLYATAKDFLAASEGKAGEAAATVTGTSLGAAADGLSGGQLDSAAKQVGQGPAGAATGRGASVALTAAPSELADWAVEEHGNGFSLALPSLDRVLAVNDAGALVLATAKNATGKTDRFFLELASGCAVFPEIDPGVEGPVATGATEYGEVSGYFDAHLHMMAFEFLGGRARCGRPWHRYGVAYALQGCKEHEIAGGRAAVLENFLSGRDPVKGHDTNAGWPTFTDWPQYGSLTYEQVYYKWMERAWRGGLRMFTNLLVDNNQLCKVYPYKRNSCNEMDGVRLQHKRISELQDYIDAQYGGPGLGWFRIVKDPFEARRVMNSGKLAVVLGIEVSVLFDCGVRFGMPTCTKEQIDRRLDEVYAMGVRQMELVNKFDNGLSGVTGDNAAVGALVNGANFLETGKFWPMQTCTERDSHTAHAHDRQQYNLHDESGAPDQLSGRDSLVGVVLQAAGGTGAAPIYPEGPHCSALGLSDLGAHLINRMMDKGMIFDPDHMSAKARTQAMDIVEQRAYSGVISSHSWADDTVYPRIWKLGGVVAPHGGTGTSFVEKWRKQKAWADPRFTFGLGFGSDMNGFSTQGAPRGTSNNPVPYPFTGFGGATVKQQQSGSRVFNINSDGVAHYGMYPDWVEEIRRVGGAQGGEIVADMQRAPEAYLQMWERASGVAPSSCRTDVPPLGSARLQLAHPGMTAEEVLLALGQPARREGGSFTYCAEEGGSTVTFNDSGRVSVISPASVRRLNVTAPGTQLRSSGAAAPGADVASASSAGGGAPSAGSGAHDHATHVHRAIDARPTGARRGADLTGMSLLMLVLAALAIGGGVRVRRR